MKRIAPLLFALTSFNASASGLRAPDFQVSTNALEVKALAPAGHHFNTDAPMMMNEIRPTKKSAKEVLFQAPTSGQYEIKLFLCDDALTFCEKHMVAVSLQGNAPADKKAEVTAATAAQPLAETSETKKAKLDHGFILNDPETALRQAKNEGKPLMIDFFGIWCPPCNQLDEKVFSSAEFSKRTARFVKLKLDVDQKVSWDLVAKYKVEGYPTVIFASPEGEEILRFAGFRPKGEVLRLSDKAYANRKQSLEDLQKKADAGNIQAAEKLGAHYYDRSDYANAEKYLKSVTTNSGLELLFESRLHLASTDQDKKEILKTAIAKLPKSPDSIEWRMQLAELEKNPALRREGIALAREYLETPQKLDSYDIIPTDLWVSIGEAHEALGEKALAQAAFKSGALEAKKNIKDPTERGHGLDLAYCLWKSGDVAAAESQYRTLEKAYPDEFTFYHYHARMLMELKRLDEAAEVVQKSVARATGSNYLNTCLLAARIDSERGKKKEALTMIHNAIAKAGDLPSNESIRSNRVIKRLRELEKEMQP